MIENNLREIWVDYVKVFACILVALGHFFMSMNVSGIITDSEIFNWFKMTIYLFHVQLFFVCSGYLYQKYSHVNSLSGWKKNIIRKGLALGIPYFTFSIITWTLKTAFATSVNSKIGGLWKILFISPTAPYWYLYSLFFIFVFVPVFKNKKMMYIGLMLAMVFKFLSMMPGLHIHVYILSTVMINGIWFVIGMCIPFIDLSKFINGVGYKPLIISCLSGALFIILSIIIYFIDIEFPLVDFLMGILACFAVIVFFLYICRNNRPAPIMKFLSAYTMPVFLMHTICAAPVRIVLMKLGIDNTFIHVILGVFISFAGPIAIAYIMGKTKYLDFLLYPTRYIKIK